MHSTQISTPGLIVTGVIAAGIFMTTPSAWASNALPEPISVEDLAAATRAADSEAGAHLAAEVALRAQQLDVSEGRDEMGTFQSQPDTADLAPSVAVAPNTATVVNTLRPEFVISGELPIADFSHVANTVVAGDQQVTVWTVKDGGSWRAVNAAAGALEADIAEQAEAPVFNEPQIGAWYTVRGDRVVALNEQARTHTGDSVTVEEYATLVHGRYAEALEGSAYDTLGLAGGYGTNDHVEAAASSVSSDNARASSDAAPLWFLAGAAGLAALGAGAFIIRRRQG